MHLFYFLLKRSCLLIQSNRDFNFFSLFCFKFHMDDPKNVTNYYHDIFNQKERISITDEACMNCYLMEIGEVDPQDGRCEKCGKRAANPLLGIA